ncbi:phosphotransferase family protein [Myxococcota bacterium]|nr:phosphotransferase family protein [Myxococcota bacterium]
MTEVSSTPLGESGGLPEAVLVWLESSLGGKVVHKERFVSRREGWLIDVECADGSRREGFLRLERFLNGRLKQPACQVLTETAVIASLHARGFPVPAVYAHSEHLQATLYERVSGRDDIHELDDANQQNEIAHDFMRHLARLHDIPVQELGLSELSSPSSPEEYALAGIEELERSYFASLDVPDPLALLTFQWLRRNIPAPPEKPVLVQGDTGPGNFVYVEERVSSILDWECAHLGDPMEDLGHLFSRAFFHPWGEMSQLLETYAATASQRIEKSKLHFYRVASFAKAALGSTVAVNHFHVAGPLPMMIFFSVAGERGLAQSVADALGVHVEEASLPEPDLGLPRSLTLPMEEFSDHVVDHELAPELPSPYLQARAIQLRQIGRYQARREQHLSALAARELEELQALSSKRVSTIKEGIAELNTQIEAWNEDRVGDIARYLTRRAQRAEALALPLAGRYANLHLSSI